MSQPTPDPLRPGSRAFHFFWQQFLTRFCYRLPLPLSMLLVCAMIVGAVGKGLGVPSMVKLDLAADGTFWDAVAQLAGQALIGFALGVVWMQCLLIGYLIAGRGALSDRPGMGFGAYAWGISVCLAGTALTIWLVIMLAKLGTPERIWQNLAQAPGEILARLGLIPGAAVAVLLMGGVRRLMASGMPSVEGLRRHLDKGLEFLAREPAAAGSPPMLRRLLGPVRMLLLGMALYLAWAFLDRYLGAVGSLLVGLVLLVAYLLLFLVVASPSAPEKDGQGATDAADHLGMLAFLLVAVGLLLTLSYVDALASPLVVLSVFWMILLAVYGLLAFFLERYFPAVGLAVVGLLLVSGLPLFKYRVPGLDYDAEALNLFPLVESDHPDAARLNPKAPQANDGQHPFNVWEPLTDSDHLLHLYEVAPAGTSSARNPHGQLLQKPRRRPVVVVTVSGGGLSASAWTLAILQRLESEFGRPGPDWKGGVNFPAHVRVITGASGGMLGASYYAATLPPVLRPGTEWKPDAWSAEPREGDMAADFASLTDTDFLTPVTREMVYRDLPHFLSPWERPHDRGRELEDAWTGRLRGGKALDAKFVQLKPCEQDGRCPSLIFSPMLVEDGRRLLISNLDLRYASSNDGNLLNPTGQPGSETGGANYSREAVELFRMFPDAQKDMSLATAVRLSASFPYVSPAAYLPTKPARRVVDAGYYDNDGTSVAASWLFSRTQQEWFKEYASGIVLIQIRASASDATRRLKGLPEGKESDYDPSLLDRALEQLTTPPEALWQMRVASTSFRNDGLLELLSQVSNEAEMTDKLLQGENESKQTLKDKRATQNRPPQKSRRFTVVTFEQNSGPVSLSWRLTREERDTIRRASGWPPGDGPPLGEAAERARRATDQAIDRLKQWWKQQAEEEQARRDANP